MGMWILAAVVAVSAGLVAWWLVRDCERSVAERLRRERLRKALEANEAFAKIGRDFREMKRVMQVQLEPAMRNMARAMTDLTRAFNEANRRTR